MKKIFAILISALLCGQVCHAAGDTYSNQGETRAVEEGSIVLLPDGSRTIIEEYLPNGNYATDNGLIISPQGVILEGDYNGQSVILAPGGQELSPGTMLELPDGSRALIREKLPNGDFRTDTGLVISPTGIIREGDYKGRNVFSPSVNLDLSSGMNVEFPNGSIARIDKKLPNGNFQTNLGIDISPQGVIQSGIYKGKTVKLAPAPTKAEDTKKPAWRAAAPTQSPTKPHAQKTDIPQVVQRPARTAPENIAAPSATPTSPATIAEMLPLTDINETGPGRAAPVKRQPASQEAPSKTQPKPQARKTEPAPTPKAQPAKPRKAGVGQEMRIPEESIKTGNLEFLSGCWQGTRPEYFSKRTIRECFCFDSHGKSGKRRVIDPQGGRNCIGATRATLSRDGILRVTSEGAPCSDGERWGSANMTCRNSGQRTPCSWIFGDAGNGTQAYTIPFIRVQSCGR